MDMNIFKSGDIFKFKDKEYIVIQNYGDTALVKENIDNGIIIKGFSWNRDTDACTYLRSEKDHSKIDCLISEYESFFENYTLK